MAENQDGQEKTQEPTAKRLEKAAEEGQILSSKEVTVFTTMAAGLALFLGLSPFFEIGLNSWATLFQFESADNLTNVGLSKIRYGFLLVLLTTLIFGIPLMVVIVITQAAVGGLNYSNKAYTFKPNKINPIAGLKKIFSAKGLVELGKAVLKVILLFSVGAFVIFEQLPLIKQLSLSSLGQGLSRLSAVFPLLVGAMLIALFFVAIIDYFWMRYSHKKSLMMTPQEVKEENKDTNGSPEVRNRIRKMQYEKSMESSRQRDALDNVSSATAVITNPTHFAVALKYTAGQAGAPEVVAMGRGPIAMQIIDRARDARVTTLRIPVLARALYFTSEIGGEIAEGLYNAVAVILAYVFRIDSGESMDMPELTLPPELLFDENGNLEQGAR